MRTVGILLFDDVEVLDACGPYEVFSVANRVLERIGQEPQFDVLMVGIDPDFTTVTARGGLRLGVDVAIDTCPELHLLLVPGGVTTRAEQDEALVGWLRGRAETPVIASVCTGAFLLADAGLLTGREVTTHWEDQAALRERHPDLTVLEGPRWVGHSGRFTSAGIAAGIDLALALVAHEVSEAVARATARQMDYPYPEAPSL